MGMYLMMMYVSLEQEEAVKHFFSTKGWSFQKPDLSVLTDRTGPLVIPVSEPTLAPTETGTPEQTEAGRKPVTATHTSTSAKTKTSPKQQQKTGKVSATKRSANTEKREFEEILKEAEIIAASVSEIGESEENEGTETSVKMEQERESFIMEQTDNYDDTYDDYDDFNEGEKGETEVSKIEFVKDSVTQGPSDDTLTSRKRKLGDRSELSEMEDFADSQEAAIKEELEQMKTRRTSSTGLCTICGKVLYSNLNRHMQLHEEGGHRCEHCGKLYLGRDKYEQHIRTKHRRESVGHCDVCDKTFLSIEGYQNHMKTHQLENNFRCECSICGKKFVHVSTYKKHLPTHSTKKPFCCSGGCGKTFKSKYSMQRHVCKKVKEPPLHVCRICRKMFSSYTNLKEHQRLHSDSLDYQCNTCGRKFRWHTSLTRHERKCLGSGDDSRAEQNEKNVNNDHAYTSQ